MYSIWKRRSTAGTVVGSVAGATPILAGYIAARGKLDTAGAILFFIMVLWQMPHFYAIALYHRGDYAAAGLPVMPIQKGSELTKFYILLYVIAFTIAVFSLVTFGYAGIAYLAIMGVLCFTWAWKGIQGFKAKNDALWAKNMFRFSVRVMAVFSLMIAIDNYLP